MTKWSPAEGHHLRVMGEGFCAAWLSNALDGFGGVAVVDEAVAVVGNGEMVEGVESERVGVEFGEPR